MRDAVIVLSGGVDSTTMLYEYRERIAVAVTCDYGSKHNAKEIPFAQLHCQRLGIEHVVIPLDFMQQYFQSSLLQGGEVPPASQHFARRHDLRRQCASH